MSGDTKRQLLALRISPPRMTRSLVGALAVGSVVLFWWLATTGLGSLDLARNSAESCGSDPQLPEPSKGTRVAAEHRGDAEARVDWLRPRGYCRRPAGNCR